MRASPAHIPSVPAPLRNAFPGYFALVMATGIVSIALADQGFAGAAWTLFAINAIAYVLLWGCGFARLAAGVRDVAADLADHRAGPAFLTVVAGTCVLGVQCVRLAHWPAIAAALWLASLVLWFLLLYGFLAAVTLVGDKPRLEHGIDGSWLLATVATEAVAVLGTLVADAFPRPDAVIFASLVLFLAGAMLYIVVIGLIFFRWTFRPMDVHGMTPTYWINMGAVAITTLAGAQIGEVAARYPFVAELEHFVAGFTLFFWATGTWWIPLLVIMFVWRHLRHGASLRYDSRYWSLVFPLGMYSVATQAYAHANKLAFLLPVARIAGDLALVAWALTALGLVRQLRAHGAAKSVSEV
ncbi:MAG TPA: tellurite resistance/C4-dicarboxylate transporter family protein [Casimicrobiaceae bacterium]|nr:tellurite resistance/C4-dicarboxylate transporter family protein [Casimicrobiaceae bacterium]